MADVDVKISIEVLNAAAAKALGDTAKKVDDVEGAAKRGEASVRKFNKAGEETGNVFSNISINIAKAVGVWEIFEGNIAANLATKAVEYLHEKASELWHTFIVDGVKAAIDAEAGLNKLAVAMKASGEFTEGALESFKEYAEEVQRTTKYNSDAVISGLALAKAYGLSNDNARLATEAAIGLAAATGRDLNSAIDAVARSFNGQARELSGMDKEIKKLTESQLKAGDAARVLVDRYGTTAQGQVNTFAGAVAKSNNAFEDFVKSIGNVIINNPAVIKAVQDQAQRFADMTAWVIKNTSALSNFVTNGVNIAVGAVNAFKEIVSSSTAFIQENADALIAAGKAMAITAAAIVAPIAAVKIWTLVVGGATIAQTAWNAVMTYGATVLAVLTSPVALITAAVVAVGAAVFAAYKYWDLWVGKLKQWTATAIDAVLPALEYVIKTMLPLASLIPGLSEKLTGAKEALAGYSENLRKSGEYQVEGYEIQKKLKEATDGTTTATKAEAEAHDKAKFNIRGQKKETEELTEAQKQLKQFAESFLSLNKDSELQYEAALEAARARADQEIADEELAYERREINKYEFEQRKFDIEAEFAEKAQEAEDERYERDLERLDNALESKAIEEEKYLKAVDGLNQRYETASIKHDKDRQKRISAQKKWEEMSEREKQQYMLGTTADMFSGLAALASTGGRKTFEITKAFSLAEAITRGILAVQMAISNPPGYPYNIPAVIAATTMTAANVIKISSQKPPAYETGGIVGGLSFSGDKVHARVNSGEMILNRQQQSTLFKMANGEGGGGEAIVELLKIIAMKDEQVHFSIDGRTIVDVLRSQLNSGRSFT